MTLGALLVRTTLLFVIGAVIMVLGSIRKSNEVQRARGIKFIGFFVIASKIFFSWIMSILNPQLTKLGF